MFFSTTRKSYILLIALVACLTIVSVPVKALAASSLAPESETEKQAEAKEFCSLKRNVKRVRVSVTQYLPIRNSKVNASAANEPTINEITFIADIFPNHSTILRAPPAK